jgi:hypothetical protein
MLVNNELFINTKSGVNPSVGYSSS